MIHTIVDEGASASILSSIAWKAIGSPQLVPTFDQILNFNRISTTPIGILPHLHITLGGKIVCIDVMLVQGPLDFNFLLGLYYVYAMKFLVSTLFRVMHFSHYGKIVTIDQLFFVKHCHRITASNQSSLIVLHVLVVSSPSSAMSIDSGHHVLV